MREKEVDFSGGFPIKANFKSTGESVEVTGYTFSRPPHFLIKTESGATKRVASEEIELANDTGAEPQKTKNYQILAPAIKRKIKKRLEERKLEVEAEQLGIAAEKRLLAKEQRRSAGSNHPAGESNEDRLITLLQREKNCKKRLRQIWRASVMLEGDIYGLCEVCGEQLPIARLKEIPETTICVECKKQTGGHHQIKARHP